MIWKTKTKKIQIDEVRINTSNIENLRIKVQFEKNQSIFCKNYFTIERMIKM